MIAGEPRCAHSAVRGRYGLRCGRAPWLSNRTHIAESHARLCNMLSGLAAAGSLAPRPVASQAGAVV